MREGKENKMGVMPENKLLLSMSLPMMVSMLVQALYNIVDSIFVSYINEDALTAVSLAFPIQSLLIAFGVGTGVGVNALLSRALGEKDMETVDKSAMGGIFLALATYAVFLLVGVFVARPFYLSQTTDERIVEYGVSYLRIVCVFSIGMLLQMMLEKLLQSTGKTMFTMVTQTVGAVINIIFDPILIFGLCGFPRLSVEGAAVATIFGQCVASALALFFNLKYNKEVRLRLRNLKPEPAILAKIYAVGIPSIIMQAIGSVMTYGMNRILIGFTSTATAVFGVYFKVQSFVFMPVFGLNNGMVPIIAYNFGAGKKKRVIRTVQLAVCYALGIMAVGLLIFQLAPQFLLGLFNASEHMLSIGVVALRTISLGFLFAAFGIVSSSLFQALGNGVYSMLVSLTRQMIVLLPVAWLLSQTGNLDLVWLAFPIAEVFSFALSLLFTVLINRKVIAHIGEETA